MAGVVRIPGRLKDLEDGDHVWPDEEETYPGCLFYPLALLLMAILASGTFLVAVCHGQDRPVPTRGAEGAPGMWVPLEDFRLAVQDREALPRYVESMRLLTESLSLAHAELDSRIAAQAATDLEVGELRQSVQVLIGQVRSASARAAAAEAERDAWYRSPFLWVAIGLVVGVVGVCLVAIGITS